MTPKITQNILFIINSPIFIVPDIAKNKSCTKIQVTKPAILPFKIAFSLTHINTHRPTESNRIIVLITDKPFCETPVNVIITEKKVNKIRANNTDIKTPNKSFIIKLFLVNIFIKNTPVLFY